MPAAQDAVWIDVLPSMKKFTPTIARELGGLKKAGQKAGDEIGRAVSQGAQQGIEKLTATVEAAAKRQADASGRVRVAEARLQDLRASGKAKASQLAAAEENLARAKRGLDAETGKAEKATTALAQAQQRAKGEADQLAREVKDVGESAASAEQGTEKLKAGLLALGAVAGAGVVKGIADSINIEQVNDKLSAQLGLSVRESERAGKLAGNLYRDAYGGSLEEVNSALRGVQTNIGDLGQFSNAAIEGMGAKALDLASIMGEDVSRVTRGVGQLIRNGMAPDAEAGFDIVTAAAQRLPESMQGELLDTIEEYGADLSQLGLTGEQAFGALSSAVEAGARNVDLAADGFREFSIRAIDGSAMTAEGFKLLGMDADEMARRIAAGGPTATKATSEIIRALASTSDPIKQEAAGVALFGTRFEELGIGAIAAMDPLASSLGDVSGATDKMGKALNDNFGTRLEGWKRSAAGFVQDGIMAVVRGFESGKSSASGWQGALQRVGATLAIVGDFLRDRVIPALSGLAGFLSRNKDIVIGLAAGVGAAIVVFKAVTTAVKVWTAAQALLNIALFSNPLGIVVVAIGAFVAAVVIAYRRSETFRKIVNAAFDGVRRGWSVLWDRVLRPGFTALIRFVGQTIPTTFRVGVAYVLGRWATFRSGISAGWTFVRTRVFDPVRTFITRTIPDAFRSGIAYVLGRWVNMRNNLSAGWTWIRTRVLQPIGTFITRTVPGYFSSGVRAIGRVWDTLTSKVSGPIRTMKGWINSNLVDPLNKVTKLFGLTIPKLATGGVARRPLLQPLATGGVLRGPGTGTSDSILGLDTMTGMPTARVSAGEFVVNAKATRKHLGLLTAINAGTAPRVHSSNGKEIPGFFLGGLIDKAMNKVTGWLQTGAKFAADKILGPAKDLISKAVPSPEFANRIATGAVSKLQSILGAWADKKEDAQAAVGGGSYSGPGGRGWQWQMQVLRSVFPGLRLNSGYRPGAITALGNRSMHGLGRAVDVPPSMAVFNWIRSNFPRSAQLFFSPAGGRQLLNGRNWNSDPVTRSGHWDHVHWGYDQGGWLPPGVSQVSNATRSPEAVLNPQQWQDISRLARRGSDGGVHFNGPMQAVDPDALAQQVIVRLRRHDALRAGV